MDSRLRGNDQRTDDAGGHSAKSSTHTHDRIDDPRLAYLTNAQTPTPQTPTPNPTMKPNLLFLFADQLQAFTLGCGGHPIIKTPYIDALAADGVRFNTTYSTSPICTPFRGVLMSGQYPTQSGCMFNNQGLRDDARSIADCLNEGGYTTSYVGKWHLGASGNIAIPPELRYGFQRFAGYQCYNEFWDQVIFFDEDEQPIEFDEHRTDATATLTIQRLNELHDTGQPWAHFASFQNPHYPLQPSPEFEAMYFNSPVLFRDNVKPCNPFTPTHSPKSPRPPERDPNFQRYGRSLEAFHRMYYAMVTQLDFAIGRIIRHLKRLGQYDNTVIIVTSDHGEMMGSHGMMNKAVAFEESSRIPLIVRTPNGLRNHLRDETINSIDFNPSMLDWLGLPAESHFSGRSFASLTQDATPEEEPRTIIVDYDKWVMVRRGPWKAVTDHETGELRAIYDLSRDPYEMKNLAESQMRPAVTESLLKIVENWRSEMGLNTA